VRRFGKRKENVGEGEGRRRKWNSREAERKRVRYLHCKRNEF
jgi:hypothetical protein